MKTESKWSLVIFAVLFLASSPALAAKGLYLGAGFGLDNTDTTSEDYNYSANDIFISTGINCGYGFTKHIYAGLYDAYSDGRIGKDCHDSSCDSSDVNLLLNRIGIMGKYSFGKSRTFAPYLELGVHQSAVDIFDQEGYSKKVGSFEGVGEMAGLGIDWFVGQRKRVVLGTDLSIFSDTITQGELHSETSFNLFSLQFKVNLGYAWRPGM